MSEYTMACTVGAPGQTSAIVIVARVKEYGLRDPVTLEPRVTQKLNVVHCERLPAGLKDSEIAARIELLLQGYPLTRNTRVYIEHPGGKAAISRMSKKLWDAANWVHGVRVAQDSEGITSTPDGLKRVSQRELVSHLVPIAADMELRNPFPELNQQLLAADPNATWREGDSDLASALFIAAWFLRSNGGGSRSTLLV